MKRIGLVLPEAPQYSETFFNYKIKGLHNSGYEVLVFSGKNSDKKYFFKHYGAFPVYQDKPLKQFIYIPAVLTITFIKSPSAFLKLFSLERKAGNSPGTSLKTVYLNAHILPHKLDWLHFGFATMALRRENTAKAIGAKMGVSFRGYDINIYPLKNKNCYGKIWSNVQKVHTISDYLYRKALALGLSKEIPFEKITPAIDTSLFKFKDDSGIVKSPVRIITVGRLNWIKNYETAISAMKILKDKGIDFIYDIIGEGIEMERLKFAVYQYGLADRIFFHGKKDHNVITEKMKEADIYLQTSMQEGFCVSVLEAQASGLMCIVSNADGLKENVIDGITGWVVPKRDPEAFAKKIEEVIKLQESERKEITLAARKRVEKDFSIEDQNRKFQKFFS